MVIQSKPNCGSNPRASGPRIAPRAKAPCIRFIGLLVLAVSSRSVAPGPGLLCGVRQLDLLPGGHHVAGCLLPARAKPGHRVCRRSQPHDREQAQQGDARHLQRREDHQQPVLTRADIADRHPEPPGKQPDPVQRYQQRALSRRIGEDGHEVLGQPVRHTQFDEPERKTGSRKPGRGSG